MMNNIRTSEPEIDENDEHELITSVLLKLKENANLSGHERQHLIKLLQKCPNISTAKRKFEEIENHENAGPKVMKNKKVQVKPMNCKDSFAQTDDIVNLLSEGDKSEDFIIKLKRLATVPEDEKDKDKIAELMSKSFDDRRHFIMSKIPPVPAVKDKYPLLFCVDEVKNELDRIFYNGKCTDFLNSIKVYSKVILDEKKNDPLYRSITKCLDSCSTERERNYAQEVGSLLLLPKIFLEDLRFVKLSDSKRDENIFPYIEASTFTSKQLLEGEHKLKIKVEEHILCEASNFTEAVLCLVASYFIFNIDYNPNNLRTFIAFEKLYLCADETKNLDEFTDRMIKLLKIQMHKS